MSMSSYDFFQKEYPDEVKLLLQGAKLEGILQVVPNVIQDLFEYFLEVTVEDTTEEHRCIGTTFCINNTVEHTGSNEYSSSESSTYGGIYNEDKELVMEFNYSIGQAHCSETRLLSFECYYDEDYENKILNKEIDNEEEKSTMASLSTRTTPKDNPLLSSNTTTKQNLNKTGVNNMTVQTLTFTLIDNNENLKGAGKIVFQKIGFITEYTEAETKQNIIATGEVLKALATHNEKRIKVIDKAILRNTGRDVALEPIELLTDPELQWQCIRIA